MQKDIVITVKRKLNTKWKVITQGTKMVYVKCVVQAIPQKYKGLMQI